MKFFMISLLVLSLISVVVSDHSDDPDEHRSFEEMVLAHDYPLETHYCVTTDGYELKNYRIPGEKGSHPIYPNNKKPVLLGHGLADSSDTWVVNEEHLSTAYHLANNGYDVWMINVRGNKHSKKHVKINPKDKAFWNFSLHEMGTIDLVCVVDMIKAATQKDKVVYIGHSQGGAMVMALCSENPNYCKANISGIILLAPAVYLDHNRSPYFNDLVKFSLDKTLQLLGIHHIYDSRESINKTSDLVCSFTGKMCDNATKFISEDDPEDNNQNKDMVAYSHYPSGASSKSVVHFATIIRKKDFVRLSNQKPYDLSKINVDVHLYCGEHDRLVTVADALRLKTKLESNGVLKKYVQYKTHGHTTFILSKGQDDYMNEVLDSVNKLS